MLDPFDQLRHIGFIRAPRNPAQIRTGFRQSGSTDYTQDFCCQHFKQTCFDLLHTRAYTLGRVRTCEALWRKILSLNVISELLCVDKWRIRAPMTSYLWLPFKSPISCLCGFDKAHQLRSMSGIRTHAGHYAHRILSPAPSTRLGASCFVFMLETGGFTYRTIPYSKICRNWSRTSIQG